MISRELQGIEPAAGYPLLWVGVYDPDLPDPKVPDNGTLVGVAVIRTEDFSEMARRLGVSPDKEVVWAEINHPEDIPERFIGRLLNEAEHDDLSRFWPRRQADAGMH